MKTLDIRRHSRRDAQSVHLNTAGVLLARAIGVDSPRYTCVLSSPALRAIETAVAMGYAIDAECDELALPDAHGLAVELDLIKSFGDASMLSRGGLHTPAYLVTLAAWVREMLESLPDGGAMLMVTHGGVVECLAAALVPAACATLGPGAGFCEGVRVKIDAAGPWHLTRLGTGS
jgi:broad specificity phosphatase PhoE